MGTRAFWLPTIVLSLFVSWLTSAIGDGLPSKDHPSPEPFSNVQPFDLSAKGKPDAKEALPSDISNALQRNPQVFEEILKVNNLSDPQRIVFQGLKLFSEQQLRSALACDLKYQAAARPSNDTIEYLAILENRLKQGYLHSGCPDAKVHASHDSKRKAIVINVEEGRRYRRGRMVVEAPLPVDAATLTERLTTQTQQRKWQLAFGRHRVPSHREPTVAWKTGEYVSYTQDSNDDLNTAIRLALFEQGFPFATAKTSIAPSDKPGIADLRIEITGNLSACTIDSINFYGLKRDSREQLLQYLGIDNDSRLTGKAMDTICEKLATSCRYWYENVFVELPELQNDLNANLSGGAKITISLVEFAPIPPLEKPLDEVDEILRKAAASLNDTDPKASLGDAVIEAHLENVDDPKDVYHIRSAISAERGIVLALKRLSESSWSFDHSVVLSRDELAVFDWKTLEKFQTKPAQSVQFQLSFTRSTNDNGEPAGSMMTGFAFKDNDDPIAPAWKIHADPAEIVHMAHRPNYETKIHDGKLTISGYGGQFDFDAASGRFLRARGSGTDRARKVTYDMHFEPHAFDASIAEINKRGNSIANSCAQERVITSSLDFVLRQLKHQPPVQNDPTLRNAIQLVSFLRSLSCCDELLNKSGGDLASSQHAPTIGRDDRPFEIPNSLPQPDDGMEKLIANLRQVAPLLSDELFPRGSWPWTLSRELSLRNFAGDADDDFERLNRRLEIEELERAATGSEMGPLGALIFVSSLQNTHPTIAVADHSVGIASRLLIDLSDEACLKDARLLSDGNHKLAMFCREATQKFGELPEPEQQLLISMLPRSAHQTLTRLAARRKQFPTEPVGDSINQALVESWRSGLRDSVESTLRGLAQDHSRDSAPAPRAARNNPPAQAQ